MGDFSVNFLNLLSISFPVFLSALLSFYQPLVILLFVVP
jgi:hypothetical protein